MLAYPRTVLLRLVEATAGPEAVAEVKRRMGVPADRVYHINEVCEDAECMGFLTVAREVLNLDPDAMLEAYANAFFEDTLERWPAWYRMSENARAFLELQPEIHNSFAVALEKPEVRKRIADKFRLEKRDDELVIHYASANRLCTMYRLLAQKVLDHYGEVAGIDEPRCLKRGDPECEIHIRWR